MTTYHIKTTKILGRYHRRVLRAFGVPLKGGDCAQYFIARLSFMQAENLRKRRWVKSVEVETRVSSPSTVFPERIGAYIVTTKGVIIIRLHPQQAPKTVAQFVDLVGRRFYNGLAFHRYVEGHVIQGGCPFGRGCGSFFDPQSGEPVYLPLEVCEDLKHDAAGVVGMARGQDPDTASCQFYITRAPRPKLDMGYCVFGFVVSGMDVVEQLRVGDRIKSIVIISTDIAESEVARSAQLYQERVAALKDVSLCDWFRIKPDLAAKLQRADDPDEAVSCLLSTIRAPSAAEWICLRNNNIFTLRELSVGTLWLLPEQIGLLSKQEFVVFIDAAPADMPLLLPRTDAQIKFARDLVERGEAVEADADGKLPLGATHELVEYDDDGAPIVIRRRFA
jgi:cyclophilin family peptidyl-prolyl cis-trans isomerase